MFYRYKHKYNPKIDFLFLYNLNPNYNNIENFNEIKQIFKNNIIPSSNQGYEFNKFLKLYKYLDKNKRKTLMDFSKFVREILNTNINFDKFKNIKIKEITYKKAIEILLYIYKINKFEKYCIEISLLILNRGLKNIKYIPIVFHHHQIDIIKKLIEQNISKESLDEILNKINTKTKHYLKKYKRKNKKQIIKLLRKQKLIYQKYKITRIWLFGSFSNNTSTKYSDIDLIVDIEKNKLEEVKQELNKKIKRMIDIHSENEVDVLNKENIQNEKILIYESRGIKNEI